MKNKIDVFPSQEHYTKIEQCLGRELRVFHEMIMGGGIPQIKNNKRYDQMITRFMRKWV